MEYLNLKIQSNFEQDEKLPKACNLFNKLIEELKKKDIPLEMKQFINDEIGSINSFSGSNNEIRKLIRKSQRKILRKMEKYLKITTKNHYRNLWLALGMSSFGIPIGVAYGASIGNMGMLGLGLPIGMGIGIALGNYLDKKALNAGKQLDVEIDY